MQRHRGTTAHRPSACGGHPLESGDRRAVHATRGPRLSDVLIGGFYLALLCAPPLILRRLILRRAPEALVTNTYILIVYAPITIVEFACGVLQRIQGHDRMALIYAVSAGMWAWALSAVASRKATR